MSIQLYLSVFIIVFIFVSIFSILTTRSFIKKDYQEKLKSDITSSQMRESERKIKQFFTENNIQVGEPISKIAEILNVEQGGIEIGLQGQAHLSEPNNQGKMIVTFKDGLSKEEKLFVFAHECAHLINHDAVPNARPTGRNKPLVEQIADYTAAALLMPLDAVYEYLTHNNYINLSPRKRIVIIRKLCKEYGVTEIIALRRVKEVYELKRSETNI